MEASPDRKHAQPRRRSPPPRAAQTRPQVRPRDGASARRAISRRHLVGRCCKASNENSRRKLRVAAADHRRRDHQLRLHQHHLRPLRRLLEAAPEDLHAGAPEHEACSVVPIAERASVWGSNAADGVQGGIADQSDGGALLLDLRSYFECDDW